MLYYGRHRLQLSDPGVPSKVVNPGLSGQSGGVYEV